MCTTTQRPLSASRQKPLQRMNVAWSGTRQTHGGARQHYSSSEGLLMQYKERNIAWGSGLVPGSGRVVCVRGSFRGFDMCQGQRVGAQTSQRGAECTFIAVNIMESC